MSDTPRVDAMESAFQESGMYGTFAPVALCRQFEREITTLRQQVDELEAANEKNVNAAYLKGFNNGKEGAESQLSAYREALQQVKSIAFGICPSLEPYNVKPGLDEIENIVAEALAGDTK